MLTLHSLVQEWLTFHICVSISILVFRMGHKPLVHPMATKTDHNFIDFYVGLLYYCYKDTMCKTWQTLSDWKAAYGLVVGHLVSSRMQPMD